MYMYNLARTRLFIFFGISRNSRYESRPYCLFVEFFYLGTFLCSFFTILMSDFIKPLISIAACSIARQGDSMQTTEYIRLTCSDEISRTHRFRVTSRTCKNRDCTEIDVRFSYLSREIAEIYLISVGKSQVLSGAALIRDPNGI